MTQKEKILKRLKSHGSINNFWAIQNYILRLGARIYDLKREGYKFITYTGKDIKRSKKLWKNQYYSLINNRAKK